MLVVGRQCAMWQATFIMCLMGMIDFSKIKLVAFTLGRNVTSRTGVVFLTRSQGLMAHLRYLC